MKSFTIAHPEQAKQLFQKQPQLSYALFQALLLNNILPPETIYKMHAGTSAGSGPSNVAGAPPGSAALAPTPAPHARPPPHIPAQHPPPFAPQHPVPPFPPTGQQPQSMAPPPVAGYAAAPGYYRGTPVQPQAPVPPAAAAAPPATTAPAAQPANVAAAAAGIDDSQRDMLMYVLNMSQEAINALPEQQRASIMQLRNQFMPGVAPPS
ncbi:hypothetical protein CC1G_08678 [Coprinopsis cinerea okayama7|uniref:Cleavage stimulation factor subunit 2 hinge domain-containing protein n=1 Tax=Coprinopsis cinerea (strain Okayama-7 / 130 / ATCC MYA-4618 / FGSC 9003) TaxID=240176 RepID=A8NZF3_COPC7|nr:hypothetical protein CC1G_08678 [Coprinopsis cinerea okayama7\|eukprot:XP_001837665.1 hypothetical protein CC1G_08678 [Coprinopsis cinerea okayama7\